MSSLKQPFKGQLNTMHVVILLDGDEQYIPPTACVWGVSSFKADVSNHVPTLRETTHHIEDRCVLPPHPPPYPRFPIVHVMRRFIFRDDNAVFRTALNGRVCNLHMPVQ